MRSKSKTQAKLSKILYDSNLEQVVGVVVGTDRSQIEIKGFQFRFLGGVEWCMIRTRQFNCFAVSIKFLSKSIYGAASSVKDK